MTKEMTLKDALMRLAYDLIYNKSIQSYMIWWAHRYDKPLFHDTVDDYLEEELIIEWFVDRFLKDPGFKNKCELEIANVDLLDEQWLRKEMGNAYVPPPEYVNAEDSKKIEEELRQKGGEFHETFNQFDKEP